MTERLQEFGAEEFDPGYLDERITFLQSQLDAAPTDEVTISNLQEDISDELNSLWPYMGDYCAFGGRGLYYRHDMLLSEIGTTPHKLYGEAWSAGFSVTPMGDEQKRWVITYDFVGSQQTGPVDIYHIMPSGANIVPATEVDSIIDESLKSKKICELLTHRSDSLVEILCSSDFLDMNAIQQGDLLYGCLANTEAELAEITEIKNRPILFEGAHAYAAKYKAGRVTWEEIDISSGDYMKGTCLGLDVLCRAKVEDGDSIWNEEDLIDARAGLCLMVSIDQATAKGIRLSNEQTIYVPISGQELGASFISDSDIAKMDT